VAQSADKVLKTLDSVSFGEGFIKSAIPQLLKHLRDTYSKVYIPSRFTVSNQARWSTQDVLDTSHSQSSPTEGHLPWGLPSALHPPNPNNTIPWSPIRNNSCPVPSSSPTYNIPRKLRRQKSRAPMSPTTSAHD
jgi:hypothetical protein